MLPEEMRATVRQQVMQFCKVDPMLHVQGKTLERLLDQSIVRVIARDLVPYSCDYDVDGIGNVFDLHVQRTNGRNSVPGMTPYEAIEHVVEWLNWSIRADAHWMSRTTADGSIPKLTKLGSIPVMVNVADKSIAKLQEGHFEPEDEADVRHVFDLADGYGVVRLLSPKSLRNETASIQHCIGLGGYDERVQSPNHAFYSLRDPRGGSHVTMHVMLNGRRWQVREMRGKQNKMAILKYRRLMLPFFDANPFDWEIAAGHAGILVAENDTHHPFEEFPDGMRLRDLDVSHYQMTIDLSRMPKFSRNLNVGRTDLAELPDGLELPGHLLMRGNRIERLPKGLRIKGDLDLSMTSRIKGLPEDLVVEGQIILDKSKVHSIPLSIRFGSLRAPGIPIVLPENFVSHGSLYLAEEYGQIGLADGLHVKGDLILAGLAIFDLPEGLVVDGELDISRTRIKSLPKRIKVGSLKAIDSDLTDWGGLRVVDGDVDVSGSPISRLPTFLRFGGDLRIAGTGIRRVPSTARVAGTVLFGDVTRTERDQWHRLQPASVERRLQIGFGASLGGLRDDRGHEHPRRTLRSRLRTSVIGVQVPQAAITPPSTAASSVATET